MFTAFVTRNSERASVESAGMLESIKKLVRSEAALDLNYLLLIICRSAPKYQIQPTIGQSDWQELSDAERAYARHVYLLAALHSDFITRASLFELIVSRWEAGEPLWGKIYSEYTGWATICELTHALDKARPPTPAAINKLAKWEPVMAWWVRTDSCMAKRFLLASDVGWPSRLSNRYWLICIDEKGVGWLSRRFEVDQLLPLGKKTRTHRTAALTYLGAVWPPSCEVDYVKMGTHPRFLFDVWLGVAEWQPSAMGAGASEWTREML